MLFNVCFHYLHEQLRPYVIENANILGTPIYKHESTGIIIGMNMADWIQLHISSSAQGNYFLKNNGLNSNFMKVIDCI